jgi:hypothetical protein
MLKYVTKAAVTAQVALKEREGAAWFESFDFTAAMVARTGGSHHVRTINVA